ncbi:uncharacterized protein BXZ73DRAFT_50074 [Epithele typhae]|uniref:uncharacterized protein n=1 Tax=Epithele typhae TaxID=378194 RepID=UPI002007C7C5|nr:uncharacterized protein BXZ73DRAFT_50074 [Epithele typhae]KAH9925372.1 hypothetical protein BXZ73DRAFT_50074 [Epithele typhae]
MPPQSRSAYVAYILPAEDQAIERERPNRTTISRERRNIGILGGLLLEPVNERARSCLSAEIKSCQGSYEKLVELGQFYYINFIRHFKSAAVRTPRMASPPSRSSFESAVDETGPQLAPTPQNHSTAKKHALFRDGCQCMLTGKYDVELVTQHRNKFPSDLWLRIEPTRCTHIIPESVNNFADDSKKVGHHFHG